MSKSITAKQAFEGDLRVTLGKETGRVFESRTGKLEFLGAHWVPVAPETMVEVAPWLYQQYPLESRQDREERRQAYKEATA